MQKWLTRKDASSFVLFIIKISKIPCPITLSSSNFETREFTFKVANITFFVLFILTLMSSLMHSEFNLEELFRSNRPEEFLVKGFPKICSKFTGEQPCQSVISIKLRSNFVEITPLHGCSPVNLLHIFRTPFSKNTYGWLFLAIWIRNQFLREHLSFSTWAGFSLISIYSFLYHNL